MKKNQNIFDIKETKWTDWFIAFPISFGLISIASIIFQLYMRSSALSGAAIPLGVMLSFLIVAVLKDRRETGSSQLQKFAIWVIIFLIIVDVIALTIFFVNPPPRGKEAIALADIEDKSYSIDWYYAGILEDIIAETGKNLEEGKYEQARLSIEHYERNKTTILNQYTELCIQAENQSLDLRKNSDLNNLYLYCRNRELVEICKNEELEAMRHMVDFFEKPETQSKAECFEMVKEFDGTEECRNFNKELGEEPADLAEMTAFCFNLQK